MQSILERLEGMYNAIFMEDQKLANQREVAKHMARVWIYGLQGIDALHPEVKNRAVRLMERMKELGKPIIIFETIRSAKRQNELYAQGRTTPGSIVTDGRALEGYHSFGLAFDAIFKDYKWSPPSEDWWKTLGEEGEKLGLTWGGRWDTSFGGDRPHFQYQVCPWQDLKDYFEIK